MHVANPYILKAILPDYSGYNISRMFSLFKTNLSTINYPIKIQDEAGSPAVRYVFFDANGEISLTSKVSTTTTPTATSLATYVASATGLIWCTEWFCNITGYSVTVPTGIIGLYNAGLYSENGKVALYTASALGTRFQGAALTEMNATNNFSITTVSSNTSASSRSVLISTLTTSGGTQPRFTLIQDNNTSKDLVFFRNTGATSYTLDYITQQNVTTQKRLTATYSYNNQMKGYYNGTLQDTLSISGTFTNEYFKIGIDLANSSTRFIGFKQCVIVHNAEINGTAVSDLDTLLDEYFNF